MWKKFKSVHPSINSFWSEWRRRASWTETSCITILILVASLIARYARTKVQCWFFAAQEPEIDDTKEENESKSQERFMGFCEQRFCWTCLLVVTRSLLTREFLQFSSQSDCRIALSHVTALIVVWAGLFCSFFADHQGTVKTRKHKHLYTRSSQLHQILLLFLHLNFKDRHKWHSGREVL